MPHTTVQYVGYSGMKCFIDFLTHGAHFDPGEPYGATYQSYSHLVCHAWPNSDMYQDRWSSHRGRSSNKVWHYGHSSSVVGMMRRWR